MKREQDPAANEPAAEIESPEVPAPERSAPAGAGDFSPLRLDRMAFDNGLNGNGFFADEGFIDDSDTNHWSVPWSDLMMVMFVLFAALLTVQALERRVPEPEVQTITRYEPEPVPEYVDQPEVSFEPLMRINVFERSQQAVRETQIDNVEIAILEDQSVKVSVQGPMFFELGKADLRDDMREFLSELSRIIMQTPYHVNVIGHTDDYPISTAEFPSNWELSVMRAARVVRFLIGEGGVDPDRFTVMGRSEFDPVLPNEDDSARAQNRRVEIIITREVREDPDGVTP